MLFGTDGGRKEREREMRAAGRLPPGQSLTLKWPVLHYGSVPRFDPAHWDFRVFGLVEEPALFLIGGEAQIAPDFHPRKFDEAVAIDARQPVEALPLVAATDGMKPRAVGREAPQLVLAGARARAP